MDFTERIVIITGGAGGVGLVLTQRWLAAGASVLVADAAEHALDNMRDACAAEAGETVSRLATVTADVTTEQGARDIVAAAARAFGRPPDTLLHLVGAFAQGPLDAPDAPAVWNKMLALNLTSAFHCFRAMLPALRERGGGWIVGLGSRDACEPPAQTAAYSAAKAGLLALTLSLSQEVRAEGIHVNLILASVIDTPANRRARGEDDAVKWVTPADIADATFYLCSDAARAVHGATLEVYANA